MFKNVDIFTELHFAKNKVNYSFSIVNLFFFSDREFYDYQNFSGCLPCVPKPAEFHSIFRVIKIFGMMIHNNTQIILPNIFF